MKVLIMGLDCAPPDWVFKQWLPDLPNLRRLVENGVWGTIRSSDPPITVPAWATFFTGRNPGQFGVYGFRNRKNFSYDAIEIANLRSIKVDTLWDILSRNGKKVGVLGVPPSYPPKPVDGFMVGCFLTPDTNSRYTYPDSLRHEIEHVVNGGYRLDVEDFRTENKAALLTRIQSMTENRWKLARHLITHKEWDLFMMVEMGTDRIHHGFWKYFDPSHKKFVKDTPFQNCIPQYYRYIDNEIGETLELIDDDTAVIVISDHGAKRMDGAVNINDWLIQQGCLTITEKPEGLCRLKHARVDWSKTTAWAWGGYHARVFLNVKGREPEGVIAPSDYEKVQDELIAALSEIADETGRVMNTKVLKPKETYTGPYVSHAPDLLVYFDDLYWRSSEDIGHESIHSFDTEIGPDDAVHDYDGMFVMTEPGNGIARGNRTGVRLLDGAPTVLRLLDLPIPANMEGKVIT